MPPVVMCQKFHLAPENIPPTIEDTISILVDFVENAVKAYARPVFNTMARNETGQSCRLGNLEQIFSGVAMCSDYLLSCAHKQKQ